MQTQLDEAVQYFGSQDAYQKLFPLFRKKYESLGRIGGTVPVALFTDTELEDIGAFFGMSGNRLKERGSISLQRFAAQLEETKFHMVGFLELLEGYFSEQIISNKEQEKIKQEWLAAFVTELKTIVAPPLSFWVNHWLVNPSENRWIIQLAEKEPVAMKGYLNTLHRAFISLPKSLERLPMFSQRITGDPHAFDGSAILGRMLLHLLATTRAHERKEAVSHPVNTEETNALYEYFHIYRDDLLNFVTCANLIAETKEGLHPVWQAAANMQTVQIVPLRELTNVTVVRPAESKRVYVVENSGVCATLLDQVPGAPMVCTNGQFTLASWLLLEKLCASGTILYYAGDLDPEGLQIADRLRARFGEAVHLWHMDSKAYEITNPQKELTPERLEKVNGLVDEALVEVGMVMKQTGKAGYQEALVQEMVKDMN